MYAVIFPEQDKSLLRQNKEIQDAKLLMTPGSSEKSICLRQGNILIGYNYIENSEKWVGKWEQNLFNSSSLLPLDKYPWHVINNIFPNGPVVLVKHPDGIQFYQVDKANSMIHLVTCDKHFHDVYNLEVIWGSFYPDKNEFGLFTRNSRNEIMFYVIAKDSVWTNTTYPVIPTDFNLSLRGAWLKQDTDYTSNFIQKDFQDSIILRNYEGMEIYKFNNNYELELTISTKSVAKSKTSIVEQMTFANLTNEACRDILQLNNSGLYVYQYQSVTNDYVLLAKSEAFSASNKIHLLDINNDGREEIIFTGSDGLTAINFQKNTWTTILESNNLLANQRYGNIIQTMPQNYFLFIQDFEGNLQWAQIVASNISATSTTTTELAPVLTVLNKIHTNKVNLNKITRTSAKIKPILRLSEQWSADDLKDVFDEISGIIEFRLPLINLLPFTGWDIKLSLMYNSNLKSEGLLGVGYNNPFDLDCIVVNYPDTFPSVEKYYLVFKRQVNQLERISQEKDLIKFQIEKYPATSPIRTISYNQNLETWFVESEEDKLIFGNAVNAKTNHALTSNFKWPNWRGPGTSSNADVLIQYVNAWYLNTHVNKISNRNLYYFYDMHFKSVNSNRKYVSEVNLKSIQDDDNFNLVFHYETKSQKTNFLPDKMLMVPIPVIQSHYLVGYELDTKVVTQNVKFIYQSMNDALFLKSIQQVISGETVNELQLKYFKESVLSSLKLKNGFETTFEFQSIHAPSYSMADKYIRPVMEQGIIRYGSDYSVITHKYKNQIFIQIYNKQMSEDIFKYINNIDSKILAVEIQAFNNFFIVDIMTESEIIIYIYNRHQDNWLRTPNRYSFHNKSIARYNEMLIVVSEASNNLLFVFSFREGNWREQKINLSQSTTSMFLNEEMIIIHANTDLKIFYRNGKDQWDSKLLKNNVKSSAHLLNKFDLNEEDREYYKSIFARNDLQVYNNLIVLRVLIERNGQLLSVINWFLLNNNYNIAEQGNIEHIQDNLLNLSIHRHFENIILYLGYVIENGYFKLTVKYIGGEYLSSIRNSNRREDARNDLLKKVRKDMEETPKKTILLNLNTYFFKVNPEGVYIHDTLYRMTGTSLQTENVSFNSIPLHKYFILIFPDKKQEKMSLYHQNTEGKNYGNVLKEFKIFSGTYVIKYPFYIAVQTSHNKVEMLTFENDRTVGSTHYFNNENLVFESTHENIITIANSTKGAFHSKLMEYIIRPIAGLVSSFIKQVRPREKIIRGGNMQRKTAYNYSVVKDVQNDIFTREVTVIPGGNNNIAGKIILSFSQNIATKNVTETKYFYDFHNKLVKKQTKLNTSKVSNSMPENSNKELKKKEDEMKLLSHNKRFIISENLPFQLSDEMFAYYGFEAYEKKQFGNKTCCWESAQVIENSFSFTGQNYLHMSNNGSFFEGSVQPKMQIITYLASCWIRTNVPLETNSAISFFKAIIRTSSGKELVGLFGTVKEQDGDWYYIELPIDFALVRDMYEEYMINTSKIFDSSETVKFVIILRILNTDYDFIDVDHIRFGPLIADTQVSVYHPFSGLLTAIIHNNGLVTRTIYNHFLEEMSDIDETGNVKQFVSKSKTGLFTSLLYIEPETGYYEKFDVFSLQSWWNVNNPSVWKVSQGQLWHCNIKTDQIELLANAFDACSTVFRFYYTLESKNSSFKISFTRNDFLTVRRQNEHALLNINNKTIPLMGELIIFIHHKYMHFWSEGQVVSETKIKSNCIDNTVKFDVTGEVLIQDLFVMNRPSIRIEYNNIFGEVVQLIEYENTESVLVTATLYDILGRKSIITKRSRINRQPNRPILSYHAEFITNGEPESKNSVWETGKLEGAVYKAHIQDQGFAYSRIEYFKNPLAEKKTIGLPGVEFSIVGTYSTKYVTEFNPDFLNWQFPNSAGFTKQAEFAKNSNIRISVFDKNANKVALYSQLSNMNPILSTYEYDQENRLVKILPPQYHEAVKTVNILSLYRIEDKYLSAKEKELQMKLGTHYHYNEFQQLFRKITPDAGIILFLYNSAGYKRFMVYLNEDNTPENVLYFDYNLNGRIIRTGRLMNNSTLSLHYLETIKDDPLTIATEDYQQFDYAEDHEDHKLRNRINNCITHLNRESVMENIVFNSYEQVTNKTAYSTLFYTDNDVANDVRHAYINNKLYKTVYPLFQELQLVYLYNQLNEIIEQQLWNNSILILSIKFSYRGDGQLEIENYQGFSENMTRTYSYNSPGYLTQISDPFLTQNIAYTQNGYGEDNFDSKMVMQTIFYPTWERQDFRWFRITEAELKSKYAAICLKKLKKHGYLNDIGLPMRLYVREKDFKLPLVCRGETEKLISELIAQRYIPNSYGFNLAYGNYEELVAAKYFTDETQQFVSPLQENIFYHRIANLTAQDSTKIWQLLVNANYIQKLELNPSSTIGLTGSKNFFRENDLSNDLKVLGDGYIPVLHLIQKLIVSKISERNSLTEAQVAEYFMNWKAYDDLPSDLSRNYEQDYANKIAKILIEKGYMPDIKQYSSLESSFIELLKDYKQFIPDILNVINNHRIYRLGESPFDLESYDIDANGNHLHFYDGYNRFVFKYENGTNKISTININSETYSMQHDLQGNVVQALHKRIEEIEYHPVSQRTMKIRLTGGKYICYYYDARGERIMKKSFASNDKLSSEVFYVRDEMGRVLVDRRINYDLKPIKKVITAYVYGPTGLLGFYRNNSFFTVVTDHIGSVRLIVNKGKVVAFYDYLPYGKLMRSFEKDSDSGILYRFTGQEWDIETDLYNYHARLYDPTIGRFYQPDPKAQYFSPYKYAGNAPISYVDPDGQFAFIALLLLGISGAAAGTYLRGAAVNNRWNPAGWDFSDPQTVHGMIEGGIGGALLPVGFVGSAAVIGVTSTVVLGLGGSYLSTAATFKNFNPRNWPWKDPQTFDSLFQGFAVGSSITGGIKNAYNFANKLSTTNKYIFYGGMTIFASEMMYKFALNANDGQWDWENPGTYWGLVSGFDMAVVLPPVLLTTTKGLAKVLRNPKNIFSGKFKRQNKIQVIKSILRDPESRLYKIVSDLVLACYMGANAIDKLDIKKWNSAAISTYQNILQDVYTGKNLATHFKTASEARLKKFSLKTPFNVKSKLWCKTLKYFVSDIKKRRISIMIQKEIYAFFIKPDLILSTLKTVRNQTAKNNIRKFYNMGIDSWKQRKTKVPVELQDMMQQSATQIVEKSSQKLIASGSKSDKQQKMYLDEHGESYGCISASRIRRMDYLRQCILKKSTTEIFKNDTDEFMQTYPFTTKSLANGLVNGEIQDYIFLREPGGYKLTLAPDYLDRRKVVAGYWLSTSGSGQFSNADATVRVNAINPEAKVIFTGELQGCSIYARYDPKSQVNEFYHFNRPNMEKIYENMHDGQKLLLDKNDLVDMRGQNIKYQLKGEVPNELSSKIMLVNVNGNRITPNAEGVLTFMEHLYIEQNGIRTKIKNMIFDGKTKSMDLIVENNRNKQMIEDALAEKYTTVIPWEKYLGHPANYELLQQLGKFPFTFASPIIYFDNNKQWVFACQKLTYTSISSKDFVVDFGLHPPQKIAMDLGPNVKMPSNPDVNYNPKFEQLLEIDASDLKSGAQSSERRIRSLSLNKTINAEQMSIKSIFYEKPAKSGSSRLQFGPLVLLSSIFNLIPNAWKSFYDQRYEQIYDHYAETTNTVPSQFSLLEFGDNWLQTTDFQGILTWGIFLVRKCTKQKRKPYKSTIQPDGQIVIDLMVMEIVDTFFDTISQYTEEFELPDKAKDVINNSVNYFQAAALVREKLKKGEDDRLSQLLCLTIIYDNLENLLIYSNKQKTTDFWNKVKENLFVMNDRFVAIEQSYFNNRNCVEMDKIELKSKSYVNVHSGDLFPYVNVILPFNTAI